jgi:hypothetical protein
MRKLDVDSALLRKLDLKFATILSTNHLGMTT